MRPEYENLPAKLEAEGVNPNIPWLDDFKLDFRFKQAPRGGLIFWPDQMSDASGHAGSCARGAGQPASRPR